MKNIQVTTEREYNHPIDSTRATGVHAVVIVDWEREYHHFKSFRFSRTDRINPDAAKADSSADRLVSRIRKSVESGKLGESHLKSSAHWGS